MADALLSDAPQLDLLHVPGGPGQEALMENEAVLGLDTAAGCRSTLRVLGLHGCLDLRSGWTDQRSTSHDSLEFVQPAALLWRDTGKRTCRARR